MGIVLNGELLFQFQDCLVTNEWVINFIPANTYYSVTAGQQGAQFLFAVPKNTKLKRAFKRNLLQAV